MNNRNRFSFNLTCICTVISFSVAVNTLQFPKVSVEAIESSNNLDIAYSALFILVFLPINDFLGGVCLIVFEMTVQLGGEKND